MARANEHPSTFVGINHFGANRIQQLRLGKHERVQTFNPMWKLHRVDLMHAQMVCKLIIYFIIMLSVNMVNLIIQHQSLFLLHKFTASTNSCSTCIYKNAGQSESRQLHFIMTTFSFYIYLFSSHFAELTIIEFIMSNWKFSTSTQHTRAHATQFSFFTKSFSARSAD